MAKKPLDCSALPDGFLVEVSDCGYLWGLQLKCDSKFKYFRPVINYPHHNDGSIVLPDGLVIKTTDIEGFTSGPILSELANLEWAIEQYQGFDGEFLDRPHPDNVACFEILGVSAEYGEQLGMKVIKI